MKNSKYKQGALRIIVSESGAQYLATPEGTPLPCLVSISVFQDYENAVNGTVVVDCEIYIQKEGSPSNAGAIEIMSNEIIKVRGIQYSVTSAREIATTPGDPCRAMIRTTAYLDTTA